MLGAGFISVLVLAAVHIFANRTSVLGWVWKSKFLSFASGVSFAYVFVDLLPALEKGQPALKRTFENILPYLDRHTYLLALLGVLFFYGIQYSQSLNKNRWLTLNGYLLFNFLVGTSLADSSNPEIQPLTLYTIAIGLHYFIRDHLAKISENRPILIALIVALFVGYFVGVIIKIPESVAAIAISFVAGGVILNVLHYELPKKESGGYISFVFGALLYTAILLSLGEVKL